MEKQQFEIVAYQDRHADDFARLNREWLDRFELYEEADGKHLYSPREYILNIGGEIFIAKKGGRVVGTCALVPVSDKVFEVAKLAVSHESRGEGLGRRLVEFALKRAEERGAMRVILFSSSKLGPALKLYESLGFKNKPVPSHQPYETVMFTWNVRWIPFTLARRQRHRKASNYPFKMKPLHGLAYSGVSAHVNLPHSWRPGMIDGFESTHIQTGETNTFVRWSR